MRLYRGLYAAALLAMPLSYALKGLFDLVGITWVDPTLILGLLIFLLMRFPEKDKSALWIISFAFLSASVGLLLMRPSLDREKSAIYVGYVEPMRLALNIIWFWVSVRFLKLNKKFVLRWLTICVTWEFLVACYLELALYELVSVPETVRGYLQLYSLRQGAAWGEVPRMAGTFIESPPFGLFMFSCFVIFCFALLSHDCKNDEKLTIWVRVGAVCAFLGSICSLSDQVVIAMAILGLVFVLVKGGHGRSFRRSVWAVVFMGLALYSTSVAAIKQKSESYFSGVPTGASIGERLFHTKYAFGLLVEQPASVLVGVGPGRYGDYAVRTGYFPSTVQPQITVIEWLVGYGVLGSLLIGRWLYRIGSRAATSYGTLGLGVFAALLLANMFQANWLWESWFLALAFLYTSVPTPTLEATRA